MALFGFGDISFNKGETSRKGPLGDLVDNKFKTTTLRYPMDVGNYDKAHYMVFYIRQQRNTSYKGTEVSDSVFDNISQSSQSDAFSKLNSSQSSASALASSVGGELLNKLNSGLGEINKMTGGALSGITSEIGKAAGGAVSSINNLFGQKTSLIGGNSASTQKNIDTSIKKITNNRFLKTTTLTTDAVALYMPDTLNYSYSQSYDQLNLGDSTLGKVMGAGKSAVDSAKEGKGGEALGGLAKAGIGGLLQSLASKGGPAGQVAFTAVTGTVSNPMLEMIYKSPNFRQFQFDFTFYPRDEREALEVQKIIDRFRFHQAPEIAGGGIFLVPPSEFDIKFYYGGAENPNIPPVTTCVLTTIDTNYAPNGFSAYEVPGENQPSLGRTGMPTAITLTLQFQETSYLTKRDFKAADDYEKQKLQSYKEASQQGQYGSS